MHTNVNDVYKIKPFNIIIIIYVAFKQQLVLLRCTVLKKARDLIFLLNQI